MSTLSHETSSLNDTELQDLFQKLSSTNPENLSSGHVELIWRTLKLQEKLRLEVALKAFMAVIIAIALISTFQMGNSPDSDPTLQSLKPVLALLYSSMLGAAFISTSLLPETEYEKLRVALGAHGLRISSQQEITNRDLRKVLEPLLQASAHLHSEVRSEKKDEETARKFTETLITPEKKRQLERRSDEQNFGRDYPSKLR